MIGIKATLKKDSVVSSLDRLPEALSRSLSVGLNTALTDMASIAKINHRYKVRTGTLYKATQAMTRELKGDVFINDSVAHYGVYVHEGHGTWAPDKFVYKAVLDNEPNLTKALEQSIAKAITEVGL